MSPRYGRPVMPGGHLVTAAALSGVVYAKTGSAAAATGCFLGGFLIDADHYFDYIFIDRQWRRPWPAAFLRHYFEVRFKRLVLPLHSWEVLGMLVGISVVSGAPLLVGYVAGAIMHLLFDILINGEHGLKNPIWFYSFVFRARHGFLASRLLHPVSPRVVPINAQFWRIRPMTRGGSLSQSTESR